MDDAFRRAWETLTEPGARFAWSMRDVRGIPTRTYDDAPPHMRWLWELSAGYGDQPYLTYGDEHLSYTEAHAIVASLARHLTDTGVGPGDRVAIAMRNLPEWVLTYWATLSVGAAVVALNAWWTGPELAYALRDSTPRVLVADHQRLATIAPQLDDLCDARPAHIVAVRAEDDPSVATTSWTDAVATPADGLPEVAIDTDDDCSIFYTSGTTGVPKGAALTHRGCVSNVMNFAFWTALARQAEGPDGPAAAAESRPRASVLAVPLFHVTGCNCSMHLMTGSGGHLVLMHRWDPGEALELIERYQVTNFTGVPVMSRELVGHPDFASRDTSSLTNVGGGGAPLQPDLVTKIDEATPMVQPTTGYGLTETSGVISINSSRWFVDKPTTVGPPLPTIEVQILDAGGKPVPTGEVGEVTVKGPNNARGYLNQPEATAAAFPDGWFRTGDLGTLDDDGFLTIVDRAKDMVLRGGENVYCAEVEAALFDHPAVRECAVFAIPHERLGETVGAAVVIHDGHDVGDDDLQSFCAERIARYKIPERIWFIDALPRNANGKFLKRELRDQLVEG